jgi:hypothetical protein
MNNPVKLTLAALVFFSALLGQTATVTPKAQNSKTQIKDKTPEPDVVYNKDFTSNIFILKNHPASHILKSIKGLGSGFHGALMETNESGNLNTITVKDFPQNIESIAAAIKYLDYPMPEDQPAELRLDVIWASRRKLELNDDPVPEYLSEVISSISDTLSYKYFSHGGTFMQSINVNNNAFPTRISGVIKTPDGSSERFSSRLYKARIDSETGIFSTIITVETLKSSISDAYINVGDGNTAVIGAVTVSDTGTSDTSMIVVIMVRSI